MKLLNYEDQIYLIYYYLVNNFIDLNNAIDKENIEEIKRLLNYHLENEYGINDNNVTNTIFNLIKESIE